MPLGTAANPLEVAIVQRLKADATLMALVTGVFANVPQDQPFDYVEISGGGEVNWSTFGREGRDVSFDVKPVTEGRGKGKGYTIADRCIVLLNRHPFTVAGLAVVMTRYRQSIPPYREVLSAQRTIWHFPLEFQVLAHES